jgi:hypothetical protein
MIGYPKTGYAGGPMVYKNKLIIAVCGLWLVPGMVLGGTPTAINKHTMKLRPFKASLARCREIIEKSFEKRSKMTSALIQQGPFTGYRKYVRVDSSDPERFELVVKDGQVFQIVDLQPIPEVPMEIGVQTRAFVWRWSGPALGVEINTYSEDPRKDSFGVDAIAAVQGGGTRSLNLDGVVFTVSSEKGIMRLSAQTESVCKVVGPPACSF